MNVLKLLYVSQGMAVISHIDLDAFFASCERRRDPSLEEGGVVICMFSGRSEDSGAVSTAGYTARDLGIHAGMPIARAKDLAADADVDVAFMQADKTYYKEVSERVMDVVQEHVDEIEAASIDEAYADLSHVSGYREAEQVMQRIKSEVWEQEGITASAGIGPNKLVAKMASDRDKPDGLTVVPPGDVDTFLADMPVDELHGVGPKTVDRLQDMDVTTVDELRDVPVQRLVQTFGESRGVSLYDKAHGRGSETLEHREQKQLSRIETLPENTRQMSDLRPVIRDLAAEVIDRVEQQGVRYARVAAIVVTDTLDRQTRSTTLKAPTQSQETLFREAEDLAADFLDEQPDTSIRRIGVRAAAFDSADQQTLDSF